MAFHGSAPQARFQEGGNKTFNDRGMTGDGSEQGTAAAGEQQGQHRGERQEGRLAAGEEG